MLIIYYNPRMTKSKRPYKHYIDIKPCGTGYIEATVGKVGKRIAQCRCHELPLSKLPQHNMGKGTLSYKARFKGRRGDVTLYVCIKCLDQYLDFIEEAKKANHIQPGDPMFGGLMKE